MGTSADPFVSITESVRIVSGIGVLREIPSRAGGMTVLNGTTPLSINDATLNQLPTATIVSVQWDQCYIYADSSLEGVTLNVSYSGTGNIYISSNRIFTKNSGNTITQTLTDITSAASQFTYIGNYNASTQYSPFNIVFYLGSSFMCTATSTGNLPTNTSFFKKISGTTYQGVYSAGTTYNNSDYVINSTGDALYVSIVDGNIGQALTNTAKWTPTLSFLTATAAEASRVTVESARVTSESSRVTAETGRTGAETTRVSSESTRVSQESTRVSQESSRQTNTTTAITNLNTTASALSHKGLYSGATAYVPNNIVNYNGTAFMCILNSTGNVPTSSSTYWKKMNNFINQGTYSTSITYMYGDCIVDSINQNVYMSIIDTNLNQLLTDTSKWQLLVSVAGAITSATNATTSATTATTNSNTATTNANTATTNANNAATSANNLVTTFVSKGTYNAATAYVVNNTVTSGGTSWRCIQNSTGNTPVEGTFWTLIAQKGADGAGTVAGITSANSDISVGGTVQNPVLTANTGTGASQIVKRDANSNISNIGNQIIPISANTTLTPAQSGIINVTTGASVVTITLPTAVGNAQLAYTTKKADSGLGTVSIATTSSQTIDGITTKTLINQYASITVVSDGANWIIKIDDILDRVVPNSTVSTAGIVKVSDVPLSGAPIVASRTAIANDILVTSTSSQQIATFTPTAKNNFMIMIYYRVITGTTNVTVQITYTDGTGAQTNTLLNAQSSAIGSYSLIPLFINATASAINVNVTASIANQVYTSVSIMGV